ncbi:MAG: cell division protein FtsA [Candidatus Omnitrophica bacterium]|nr:cell division protein FtsA [Candidatus Omnitrophota bacterium]MDD5552921.1 cell division protein FtsA [Candidatus Omnitrophota bacterium]
MNMLRNYICALDISSSKVAAAVALTKNRRIIDIFFATQSSNTGIKNGSIVDSIDLTGSIGSALKNLKAASGVNIKYIYANASGSDIVTKHSRAIIPLAERGNKVITLSDIHEVNEQARILGSSLEEEIIHMVPQNYAIDSNECILNPLGLYSHRLEVDLYLVCAKIAFMQGLTRAVNHAGYEIKDIFLSGLATSEAVFNKKLREGATVLCDLGADLTETLFFNDGILKNVQILPSGGRYLTERLEEKLKISFDLAEDVKKSYGSAGDFSQAENAKEILIKQNNTYTPINQKLISEILTPGSRSICESIKSGMEKIIPCAKVDNFVACGRTVLLEGFLETLENTLGMPVKLARIHNHNIMSWASKESSISGQRYLAYVTCLGIICNVLFPKPRLQAPPAYQPSKNPIVNLINRVKEIYQEYF